MIRKYSQLLQFFFLLLLNWSYVTVHQIHFKSYGPLTCPEVIKLFSCSTQLSMLFQLSITNMLKVKTLLAFKLSDLVFIKLINVKMSTIVGILTFMSLINFMLSWVEYEKKFYNLGSWSLVHCVRFHDLRENQLFHPKLTGQIDPVWQ